LACFSGRILKVVFSRRLLMLVYALLSVILCVALFLSKVIPTKYMIILAVVLVLLGVLLYALQKKAVYKRPDGRRVYRHTKKNIVAKLVQFALCLALVFANYNVIIASSFLSSLSGGDEEVGYSVVVLADDSASSIEDVADYSFACINTDNTAEVVRLNQIVTKVSNDTDTTITATTYDTDEELINALYDGKYQALIMNETSRSDYEDIKDKFDDETKIITTYYLTIKEAEADAAEVTQEPFNIYVSGVDTYKFRGAMSLSDVNMVITFNPVTKQALLTSIPRDYYVDVVSDGSVIGKDKLTHTSINGLTCTIDSVENLLGIDINYYVRLNYTSFMNIIDALDGIDIYNPYGEFTTRVRFYTIKEGWNHLNADQALAFVRERHSFANGDRVRMKNQQLMIKAIVKKLTSASSITKLNDVFSAVSDSMETNMTSDEIRSLINMELDDMASWDIQSDRLDGSDYRTADLVLANVSKSLYVMKPDEDDVALSKQYIGTVMKNEILKIEEDDETITADPNANDKYK